MGRDLAKNATMPQTQWIMNTQVDHLHESLWGSFHRRSLLLIVFYLLFTFRQTETNNDVLFLQQQ